MVTLVFQNKKEKRNYLSERIRGYPNQVSGHIYLRQGIGAYFNNLDK